MDVDSDAEPSERASFDGVIHDICRIGLAKLDGWTVTLSIEHGVLPNLAFMLMSLEKPSKLHPTIDALEHSAASAYDSEDTVSPMKSQLIILRSVYLLVDPMVRTISVNEQPVNTMF